MEYEQWSLYQLASVVECNAEGTKCVNFPNLQQQLVWRPFSRNHNHCTMHLMSSADNERSDTLRRGDLNKYLFMTTQVVKKNKSITIYRFSHGHDIACFCNNSVFYRFSTLLRFQTFNTFFVKRRKWPIFLRSVFYKDWPRYELFEPGYFLWSMMSSSHKSEKCFLWSLLNALNTTIVVGRCSIIAWHF